MEAGPTHLPGQGGLHLGKIQGPLPLQEPRGGSGGASLPSPQTAVGRVIRGHDRTSRSPLRRRVRPGLTARREAQQATQADRTEQGQPGEDGHHHQSGHPRIGEEGAGGAEEHQQRPIGEPPTSTARDGQDNVPVRVSS